MRLSELLRRAKFNYHAPTTKIPVGKFTVELKPGPAGKVSFLERMAISHRLHVSRKGNAIIATGDAAAVENLVRSLSGLNYDVTITDL